MPCSELPDIELPSGERAVAGSRHGRHSLFAARSFLSDRVVPVIEEVLLPEAELPAGKIIWSIADDHLARSADAGLRAKLFSQWSDGLQPVAGAGLMIDFRLQFPGNWAHALNSHLPLAIYLRSEVMRQLGSCDITIVLDRGIPGYTSNLFQLFGFKTLVTSSPVRGAFVRFTVSPWSCLRAVARRIIEENRTALERYGIGFDGESPLPAKIFLSRRKTRCLANEDAVASHLAQRGYRTVYPEDLSVRDQIGLFVQASHIVAVHGAGIGPLLYRPSTEPRLRLVELLSPGHMTNYYRVMSDQVGANWVGVRGRIESFHLKGVYDFRQRYTRHSLAPFHIDIDSLDAALTRVDADGAGPGSARADHIATALSV